MTVSRETEALEQYASLIRKWNPAINLIAPSTLDEIETRHVADCQQLVKVSREATGSWVDLGSGSGLPGLVVAIGRADLAVTLVESDKRKAAFLRAVVRQLSLSNVRIVTERIEEAIPLNSSNVSARALAPLPLLMSYVARHLAEGGRAWLMKGRNWSSEVDEARRQWRFNLWVHQSETDPDAAILEIADIRHG